MFIVHVLNDGEYQNGTVSIIHYREQFSEFQRNYILCNLLVMQLISLLKTIISMISKAHVLFSVGDAILRKKKGLYSWHSNNLIITDLFSTVASA